MNAQSGLAWIFVGGILLIGAENESTSRLATALALVIMASVLFMYGPIAINHMVQLSNGSYAHGTKGTQGAGGRPLAK